MGNARKPENLICDWHYDISCNGTHLWCTRQHISRGKNQPVPISFNNLKQKLIVEHKNI